MNKILHFVGISILCLASLAEAAPKKGSSPGVPVTAPATSVTDSLPSSSSIMSSPTRVGFGFQTLPSRIAGNSSALSYLMESDPIFIQAYLTIGSTDPFSFGAGGIFRKTFYGSARGGFHFGGGAALGTAPAVTTIIGTTTTTDSKFFFDIMGVVGVHFESPSIPNIMFTLDGGPQLHIFNSTNSFTMGGFSPALGLGVHYFI